MFRFTWHNFYRNTGKDESEKCFWMELPVFLKEYRIAIINNF
jgi:hypothetical protein